MNLPSLDKFEEHVKPGGLAYRQQHIIERKSTRDDITVVYCDANRIAEAVGNPKGANVAILGAMLEKEPIVIFHKMTEAIRIELGERKACFPKAIRRLLSPVWKLRERAVNICLEKAKRRLLGFFASNINAEFMPAP